MVDYLGQKGRAMSQQKRSNVRSRRGRWLALVFLFMCTACTLPGNSLQPVEEEQIANVVTDYYTRYSGIPEQAVTIEAVEGNWARVSMKPVGIESDADIFYLQNQTGSVTAAPTAELQVQPGNQARTTTTTGWVIVAGPQVSFTAEELDAAGVPSAIRP